MPKLKKKKVVVDNPPETDKNTKKNIAVEDRDFSELIKQVQSEYKLAFDFMKPKIDEWALRLKLYNNQKRDKEAVGDPTMFTVHQTVLASLYSDQLTAEFNGREEGDEDVADTLNALARYDEDDMEKDIMDYEWDWDASFFGRGLVLFMEYDRDSYTPIPEVIDPMTWLRDEHAKSVNGDRRGRGAMRYGGRPIRLTKNEMKTAGAYFKFDDLKDGGKDLHSLLDQNTELRSQAQGLGDVSKKGIEGENKDYEILEWFTTWKSKKILVGLAEGRSKVVRYTELDETRWPILDRPIYPMAHDWDGVSIPDLTEDKQRARAVMQNLGMKGVKAGLHPMYLYNTNKIKNRADLNFEFNKFVGVDGEPTGAVMPMQTNAVKAEVKWIMDVLDTAAQKACYSDDTQTLTENGWKYFWEIVKSEKIATFNPKTNKIEYHSPIKSYLYPHIGEMYHFTKDHSVDLLVSPEHKIWHRSADYKKLKQEKSKEWKLTPANEIKLKNIEFITSADWGGKEEKWMTLKEETYPQQTQHNKGDIKIKMDDWLEFLGYFISEGWVANDNYIEKKKYRVNISQKKEENLEKLRKCLSRLPFEVRECVNSSNDCHQFDIHNKALVFWLRNNVGQYSQNVRIPKYFKNLSKRQIKILFDAYMLGDGYYGKKHIGDNNAYAGTVSRFLADDLQEISIKLGYKSKVIARKDKRGANRLPYWKIFFAFDESRITPEVRLEKNLKKIPYSGFIYCFEVPNHLFVTRRNGLVSIQGNTATPDMQQGVQNQNKRTLGEMELISSKVDTRYSLSAKIFGWSEKRFWKQWYKLYKKHFKDKIDEKSIRIAGAMGSQWRKLSRADIVMNTDPDVDIDSKILSDAKRIQKLNMFRAYVKDILATVGPNANLRFALKRLGKLSGLSKDEIERMLPPNIDELRSEEENSRLNDNKLAMVNPTDDDMIHIENHNKATDTPAKYAHIQSHKKNMLLKKEHPELYPQNPMLDPQQAALIMAKMQGTGAGNPGVPAPAESQVPEITEQ